MCLSARAVVESALMRTESRGAHFRTDYPKSDEARWRVNVFVKKDENALLAQRPPRRLPCVVKSAKLLSFQLFTPR